MVSLKAVNPPGENMTKQMARLQKMEVVWRFPNSLLLFSIISTHQKKRKIVTITISSISQYLTPFVSLEVEESLTRAQVQAQSDLELYFHINNNTRSNWNAHVERFTLRPVMHTIMEGTFTRSPLRPPVLVENWCPAHCRGALWTSLMDSLVVVYSPHHHISVYTLWSYSFQCLPITTRIVFFLCFI